MIDPIKKAIQQIEKLPESKQLEIARLIEEELSWESTLINTQEALLTMAKEALKEYKEGKASDKTW